MVSETAIIRVSQKVPNSLNPCYSGRWSRSNQGNILVMPVKEIVLILVIAVDGLGDCSSLFY